MKRAPQRFFEIVIEIIVIVSAVRLLWPSPHADNPPEPAPAPAEETAPAELPPPIPDADAG